MGWLSRDPWSIQQVTLLRRQRLCLGTVTGQVQTLAVSQPSVNLLNEVLTHLAIPFKESL